MLEIMLNKQKELQNKLSEKNKSLKLENLKTLGEKLDYLVYTKMAFDDEFRETIDALAGTNKSQKERSSLWKKWKSDNEKIRSIKFEDLSEKELKDLKFEVTDMFCFFLNMLLVLNINAEELFSYYNLKTSENNKRINNIY